jgi:hypothetical protein
MRSQYYDTTARLSVTMTYDITLPDVLPDCAPGCGSDLRQQQQHGQLDREMFAAVAHQHASSWYFLTTRLSPGR